MEHEIFSRRLHKFSAERDDDFTLWTLSFGALLESEDLLSIIESDPIVDATLAGLELDLKNKIYKLGCGLCSHSGTSHCERSLVRRRILWKCTKSCKKDMHPRMPSHASSCRRSYTKKPNPSIKQC